MINKLMVSRWATAAVSAFIILAGLALPSVAQQSGDLTMAPDLKAQREGEKVAKASFQDWHVFVRGREDERICFAATEVTNKSPNSVNHGDVFFIISNWKSGAAKAQPSLMTGYALNRKSKHTIWIGSDRWEMYANDNEAFIESPAE